MDADSFGIHVVAKNFYKHIANDVERWIDKSKYDKNYKRPHPIGKNKKLIVLFKDELGGKIMIEVVGLRAKTFSYIMDDNIEHKKGKGTKNCV